MFYVVFASLDFAIIFFSLLLSLKFFFVFVALSPQCWSRVLLSIFAKFPLRFEIKLHFR